MSNKTFYAEMSKLSSGDLGTKSLGMLIEARKMVKSASAYAISQVHANIYMNSVRSMRRLMFGNSTYLRVGLSSLYTELTEYDALVRIFLETNTDMAAKCLEVLALIEIALDHLCAERALNIDAENQSRDFLERCEFKIKLLSAYEKASLRRMGNFDEESLISLEN